MGCDYFYDGIIFDRGLQKEAVHFICSYFSHTDHMAFVNHIEGEQVEVDLDFDRVGRLKGRTFPVLYPFNFYGVIPFYNRTWDSYDDHGQFIFNRYKQGRLVTLDRIPERLGIVSYAEEYQTPEENEPMVVRDGGYFRTSSGDISFPLLLYAVKHRYCPNLEVQDSYDTFSFVVEHIWELGLQKAICATDADFPTILNLFSEAFCNMHPDKRPEAWKPLNDLYPYINNFTSLELNNENLSLRTARLLSKKGIKTLGELANRSRRELCFSTGLGPRQFREVDELLVSLQYK